MLLIFRDCFADVLVLFYFDTFVFLFFHVALPPYPDYIGQFLETQLFLSINGKPQTTAQNEFREHLKTQPATQQRRYDKNTCILTVNRQGKWVQWRNLTSRVSTRKLRTKSQPRIFRENLSICNGSQSNQPFWCYSS